MQPVRVIESVLRSLSSPDGYIFSVADLASILPDHDRSSLKMVLSRAVRSGILVRACHGLYIPADTRPNGRELFHIAAKLRAGYFNYISQETVLSDFGIISQIPIQRITIMSSGSSGEVNCGRYGTIEFTHTKRSLTELSPSLAFDAGRRLLCASPRLAWEDLRAARRNLQLVDEGALHEYIA